MQFLFSEEQTLMADAARELLVDECTPAQLREQMQSGSARNAERWQRIADMGLTSALAPEALGGLGLQPVDYVRIAEAAGYVALPEPLVEHAGVAVPLLAELADDARVQRILEPAVAGEITVAVGPAINPFVADADGAAALLLEHAGEVHLVEASAVRLTRQESVDPFRRLFKVEWTPGAATRLAAADRGRELWQQALDRAAVFTAAQCLGLAQRCNDIATAYARERQQFGKPIGANQAIKHHLATVQVKIEFARPVAYAAAAQLAAFDAFSRARVSHARLAAADAADLAARTAVQVHGAMGYSWEVDVHFFLKRALALSTTWGTPGWHRARVAHRVHTRPLGPEHTFTLEGTHG